MQAFFASTRIEERPAPFLDAEDRLRMRQTLRKYEDDLDALNEQLRAMEETLREEVQVGPRQGARRIPGSR